MKFYYLLIVLFLVGCSSIPALKERRESRQRGPASSFHCRELVANILEGRGVRDEFGYLGGLKKRVGRNFKSSDREYLKTKIPFVINELKQRRVYLKYLNRKLQSLKHEYLYKEIYYLESLLMGAPSFQKLNSLNNIINAGENFSDTQRVWMDDFISYLRENLKIIKIRKIGKQLPQNSHLAGSQYPPSKLTSDLAEKYPLGVWFDEEGFPNFMVYARKVVEVKISGAGRFDFSRANLAAGIDRTPSNFTWHHHQDGQIMMLIPKDIHDAVKHTGGVALKTQKIKRVKGVLPAGTEWAGSVYPLDNWSFRLKTKYPKGVRIKVNGHPYFRPYSKLNVEIDSTGKRRLDFMLANEEVGFLRLPRGLTWFLHEDGKTMQLLPRDLVRETPLTSPWN